MSFNDIKIIESQSSNTFHKVHLWLYLIRHNNVHLLNFVSKENMYYYCKKAQKIHLYVISIIKINVKNASIGIIYWASVEKYLWILKLCIKIRLLLTCLDELLNYKISGIYTKIL